MGRSSLAFALILSALWVAVPVAALVSSATETGGDIWTHVQLYIVPRVLPQTAWLVVAVVLGALLLGVSLAWAVSAWRFPGDRFLSTALLLPLAVPPYILAFIYLSWTQYNAPLVRWLRELSGFEFARLQGLPLTAVVLILALYPYVYLLARQAFMSQGRRMVEAAQTLGVKRLRLWSRVTLPLAVPWLASGALLVTLEVLADYGTVSLLGYHTLTTAIYHVWFGMFSKAGALQIGLLLLAIVASLSFLDALFARKRRFDMGARVAEPLPSRALVGVSRLWVPMAIALPIAFAFIFPTAQLVYWVVLDWKPGFLYGYWEYAANSLCLAALTAAIAVPWAVLVVLAARRRVIPAANLWSRIALFGYALPGSVMAIGFYAPFIEIDRGLAAMLGKETQGFVLRGTLLVLIGALLARFLAVAIRPAEAALRRISFRVEETAQLFGVYRLRSFIALYFPLMWRGLAISALLVFLETLKEIPITLMMRPARWDTLSLKIFEYTMEGFWEQAALPALCLIAAGVPPVWWLYRHIARPTRAKTTQLIAKRLYFDYRSEP